MNKSFKRLLVMGVFVMVSLLQLFLIAEGWDSYSQKLATLASPRWQTILHAMPGWGICVGLFYILLPFYLEGYKRQKMKAGTSGDRPSDNDKSENAECP